MYFRCVSGSDLKVSGESFLAGSDIKNNANNGFINEARGRLLGSQKVVGFMRSPRME